MAKRKSENLVENVTEEALQETTEQIEQNEASEDVLQESLEQTEEPNTSEQKSTSKKSSKKNTVEIPDNVDKLLKLYPSYESLYVDDKGGVYPVDAQPNLVVGAILYQNPYYKH